MMTGMAQSSKPVSFSTGAGVPIEPVVGSGTATDALCELQQGETVAMFSMLKS